MIAGADLRLLRAGVFTAVCVLLSAAGHVLAGGRPVPPWSLGMGCAVVFALAAPLAGRERSLPGIVALLTAGQVALHTLFACGQRSAAMSGMPGMGQRSGAGSGTGSGSGGGSAGLRELASQLLCGAHPASALSASEARRIVTGAGLRVPAAHGGHAGGHAMGHPVGHAGGQLGAHAASGHAAPDSALSCLRDAAHAALSLFDGPMLLGHLLAAVAIGWLLRRGESALWRLVRLSARGGRTAMTRVSALRTAMGAALGYVRAWARWAGLLSWAALLRARTAGAGARQERMPRPVLLEHAVHRRGPPPGAGNRHGLTLAA